MDLTNQKHSAAFNRFLSPSWPYALAIFFILILLMFKDIIFSAGSMILSSSTSDIAKQFIYWMDFGFSELKKGNLALWNPHLFSGTPFFGGFQSALLYPLNVFYLLFPVSVAINLVIMLHLLLMGFFMYLWAFHRGLHPLAALLTGILIMFCGPYFLHIYAGHLPHLCAMTWIPLIFLSVDGLLKKPSLGWILLGAFAFTMQILAGFPQYVYYTCLAALIYVATTLPLSNGKRAVISISTLLAVFVSGIALSSIQILTGIDAAHESIRSGGVSYSFAATFSFPPENFLTLIAPYLFGDFIHFPYWARTYLWEMNLFFSVNGLILAIYGLIKCGRTARQLAAVILVLLILALGVHTPLFGILFHYLPGFDKFRGTSKFIFPAVLFLIILSGMGLDALLKNTSGDASEAICTKENCHSFLKRLFSFKTHYLFILFAAIPIVLGALYLKQIVNGNLAGETWRHFLMWIATSGESFLNIAQFTNRPFIDQAAAFCSRQLLAAALILTITAVLWRLALTHPRTAVYGILILATFEVFLFGRLSLSSFNPHIASSPPALEEFFSSLQSDDRILNLWKPNSALSFKAFDIWGYDAIIQKRYAELINFTQGGNPHEASQNVKFRLYHPLMKMLRLRYIIFTKDGIFHFKEFPAAMSRINLITQWRYINTDRKILEEMGNPAFDPAKTVILEKQPYVTNNNCPTPGSARVVSSSSDELTIEANLSCPSILLITDNYSDGWKVKSLRKNDGRYEIIRANYTLMAIPLEKGQHIFRLYYQPASFIIGATVSIISFLIYAVFLVYFFWRLRGKSSV